MGPDPGKDGMKLAGWKKLYLSKEGQLTLIMSKLSSYPHISSLFPIPVSTANCLEKLQRVFLWGWFRRWCEDSLWASSIWCLGIRCSVHFNTVLLRKWFWPYTKETDTLWRTVIATEYGDELGGWTSRVTNAPYGVSLWKHIQNG